MDIEIPRNGDWIREGQLLATLADGTTEPIDLTGHTLELEIRALAGDAGSPVATGDITVEPGIFGFYQELIRGADLGAVSGTYQVVTLSYDLRRTDPDGILTVERRGNIFFTPGVTYG